MKEAATIEKAAEEISPGTIILQLFNTTPPVIKTLFFPDFFERRFSFIFFARISRSRGTPNESIQKQSQTL